MSLILHRFEANFARFHGVFEPVGFDIWLLDAVGLWKSSRFGVFFT